MWDSAWLSTIWDWSDHVPGRLLPWRREEMKGMCFSLYLMPATPHFWVAWNPPYWGQLTKPINMWLPRYSWCDIAKGHESHHRWWLSPPYFHQLELPLISCMARKTKSRVHQATYFCHRPTGNINGIHESPDLPDYVLNKQKKILRDTVLYCIRLITIVFPHLPLSRGSRETGRKRKRKRRSLWQKEVGRRK